MAAVVVAATDDALVRAVPGILLVLFAPGYAFSVALLPERRGDAVERLLLALGSSLALAVAGAVALDQTVGLTARSWCAALGAMTLASAAVGARRRRPRQRRSDGAGAAWRIAPAAGAMACAACVFAATAIVIAQRPAGGVQGFTILWALPKDAARGDFAVGVRSDELRTTSYVLTARSGSTVVLLRRVTLRPGASWTATATRDPSIAQALEVSLEKSARPGVVYRSVHLALGSTG